MKHLKQNEKKMSSVQCPFVDPPVDTPTVKSAEQITIKFSI